jgi:hypothetical protein
MSLGFTPTGSLTKAQVQSLIDTTVSSGDFVDVTANTVTANTGYFDVIRGITNNADISILPSGNGSVYMPSITLPVGNVIEEVIPVEIIVADLVLESLIETSNNLILSANSYGPNYSTNPPWTVYKFTTTPSPVLEIDDVITGIAIPNPSSVTYIGTDAYSKYVIVDTSTEGLPVQPEPNTTIYITRPVEFPGFSISTIANTNIVLHPGYNGNIITHNNIIPSDDVLYDLGSPRRRFHRLYLGGGTIYILDEVTNVDLAIGAKDGNFYVKGVAGFEVGHFQFNDNKMTMTDTTEDLEIGTLGATGRVVFNRDIYIGGEAILFSDNTFITTAGVKSVRAGSGIANSGNTSDPLLESTGVESIVSASNNRIIVTNSDRDITIDLPQDIDKSSSVEFTNLKITGTLNVTGNTVSTPTILSANTVLYLGVNSHTYAEIQGGGIILGANNLVSFLYDNTSNNNRWDTDGAGLKTLNLVAGDSTLSTLTVTDTARFGAGIANTEYVNAVIQIDCNSNTYNQVFHQNHSDGSNASTDYVAINDIGNDGANYINLGINSSNYSNPEYTIGGPNDGYLYVNGGNLTIGTDTYGNNIIFHVGGSYSNNQVARTTTDGRWLFGDNTIVDDGVSEIVVQGDVKATTFLGNLYGTSNNAVNANNASFLDGQHGAYYYAASNPNNYISSITSNNVITALGYTPVSTLLTVGGHALTSNVTLSKSDVGLSNVDNTADSVKNVLTANSASYAPYSGLTGTVTTWNQDTTGSANNATYLNGQLASFYYPASNPNGYNTGTIKTVNGTTNQITSTSNSSVATLSLPNSVIMPVSLTLFSGNTTIAPLTFVSGTNLTTAVAGSLEYDGKSFYATPSGTQRGLIPSEQTYITTGNRALFANTAPCSVFGKSVTVSSATRYAYEIIANLTKAGLDRDLGYGLLVGGSGVLTSHAYEAHYSASNARITPDTTRSMSNYVTSNFATAVTVATYPKDFVSLKINGIIDVTTGGTITPQFTVSGGTDAHTLYAYSRMTIYPIDGVSANTSIGTWA